MLELSWQDLEEDDNGILVPTPIITVAGICAAGLTLSLCFFWLCCRKRVLSRTHQRVPLTSSDLSQRQQLELIKKRTAYETIRSNL